MTSASLEPQPLPPSGTFKPLVSIRRHKWLALALITVIIVIGAPLVLKTSKPVYETKASIYVAQRFAKAHARLGFGRLPPLDCSKFVAPRKPSPQGELF